MKNNEEKRKREICSFVKKEFKRRESERISFELQWRLNINFFLGNQYCDILPEAGKIIQQEKAFTWQEREVFNHIAPIVESRLAKLNKLSPRVIVRSATSDEDDISSAQLATKILASAFEKNDLKSIIAEGEMWSELCGTVFYKQDWANGKFLGNNSAGEAVFAGDVVCTVCPPQEIFPDNASVQDVSQCTSVIHARIFPCKAISETFGKEVLPEEVRSLGLENVSGAFNSNRFSQRDAEGGNAMLLEYYEMPSEEFKNGRYIAVCGETLLAESELPYKNGEDGKRKLPFVQQNCISRPGTMWGISIVERCIPIQRAYNAVRNRKHEFLNRAAVGILTCEEGTVDTEDLEENGLTPGKVIVYRQGANPPSIMAPGNIPNEFVQEEQELLEEFNLISGTSDLMRQSVAPTNVTSGVALNTIAEQDDTRIAITADKVRDAVKEISRQWLRLYKQFAQSARIDRIVGDNGEVTKLCWQASQLSSDDVVHETENELSDSASSRKQMVFDLLARGLFADENGNMTEHIRARILRALGMGDWESISAMDEVHSERARRENIMLKNGRNISVFEADDHDIHINEHLRVLLSEDFEEQFGIESDMRNRFEEHILQHKSIKEAQENGN